MPTTDWPSRLSQSLPAPGTSDRRRQLLAAWERRCRATGQVEHCTGADALFLVTALAGAVRRGDVSAELGRAARTWGSRFSAPVDAVFVLQQLREAVTTLGEDRDGRSAPGMPPSSGLDMVFDAMLLEAVEAASGSLRSAARHDPLTGCANRRALDEELAHALAGARRCRLDLALVVVDLDGLKAINDTSGHAAGDVALMSLVEVLRRALREADALYRVGGDEFVVVAPFTDLAGARALMRRAERMGGPSFSWGVAGAGQADEPGALLALADADLCQRRRSLREATAGAERRHRLAGIVSIAASAVVVAASGAGLAAALTGGARERPMAARVSASAPTPVLFGLRVPVRPRPEVPDGGPAAAAPAAGAADRGPSAGTSAGLAAPSPAPSVDALVPWVPALITGSPSTGGALVATALSVVSSAHVARPGRLVAYRAGMPPAWSTRTARNSSVGAHAVIAAFDPTGPGVGPVASQARVEGTDRRQVIWSSAVPGYGAGFDEGRAGAADLP